MWAKILSYWPEGILGFITWCVFVYCSIAIYEEFKARKQRRRYKEEDDIGRKRPEEKAEGESRESQSGVRVSTTRERKLQKSVEHAKRELLQGGASGGTSATGATDEGSK